MCILFVWFVLFVVFCLLCSVCCVCVLCPVFIVLFICPVYLSCFFVLSLCPVCCVLCALSCVLCPVCRDTCPGHYPVTLPLPAAGRLPAGSVSWPDYMRLRADYRELLPCELGGGVNTFWERCFLTNYQIN